MSFGEEKSRAVRFPVSINPLTETVRAIARDFSSRERRTREPRHLAHRIEPTVYLTKAIDPLSVKGKERKVVQARRTRSNSRSQDSR